MTDPDWENYAKLGMLRAVIDPNDKEDFKNRLIDRIHWNIIESRLKGSNRLLDFGCGTGRFASRIKNMGIDYTGIDSSANMIKMAREQNKTSWFNFIHFDGFKIPFPDECFDTCVTCYVLQYIINGPDMDRILSEIWRVLALGARLIMIEQASLSNQTSGTVTRLSTEAHYITALSKKFSVKTFQRVRSSKFSGLTIKCLRLANYLPWFFFAVQDYLAKT